VSCVSTGACEAAGTYTYADVQQSVLAFGWDGSTWSQQPEPDPGGEHVSAQVAASCSTGTACSAVGYLTAFNGSFIALVERWNGTTWKIQSATRPTGATHYQFLGVSCPSDTTCTAVGNWSSDPSGYPTLTLAERWDGKNWAVQTTQELPGSTDSSLNAVDCSTAGACVAVGSAKVNGVYVTLVEVHSH
jgi:hypothetical protein